MAQHAPAAPGEARSRADASVPGPKPAVVHLKYLLYWALLFGLLYLVSLYGIVAEA